MNENDALGDSLRAMRQEGASIDEAALRTGAERADVELVAGLGGLREAAPAAIDAGFVKARFLDSIGEERKMGILATIFSSPLRAIAVAGVAAALVGGIIGGTNPGGVNETLGVSSDDDDNGSAVTPTSTPDALGTPDATGTPHATGTPGHDDDDDDDDDRNRGRGGDDHDDDDDNSGPGGGDDDDDDNSNSGPGAGDDHDDDDDSSGPGGGDDDD
jgi:hypothetical protein